VLITSIYHRLTFDSQHNKTFTEAQQVIDDRIKLEFEREQQVGLNKINSFNYI